ncbi:hypothetical protein LAZ67_X003956 [Cordylochernes scorpioides]|uniref:Uncharacterized protein n=1 Tax=Cordylochernes scorpioides TaxID=51811 RepID=A0ABY6LX24_9ARAC|nr:hypothetical protein LAZ67_X003956 [Cordylochernes scorpioides]
MNKNKNADQPSIASIELGHKGDLAGRGRKHTTKTSTNREIIKKQLQRNSRVFMRNIAGDCGISKSSVYRIAKRELNIKAYKLQKVKLLTDGNKRVRLERCRQLKHRATRQIWERILFTEDELFIIEKAHNHQNYKSWSAEPSGTTAIVEHRQNPQSVGVWAGFASVARLPSCLGNQGVINNKEVIALTFSRPSYSRGLNRTSAMRNGRYSRTPPRCTRRNLETQDW